MNGKITRYLYKNEDPASFRDNDIGAILEDRKGSLWIGTRRGLMQVFGKKEDISLQLMACLIIRYSVFWKILKAVFGSA
ncbi:MAG: hypothetical protein JXB26_03635 [Candidatus Aminicenantes bacterium]|nr:hypothetical protein [Candidatus Aminicenantes bacterium]